MSTVLRKIESQIRREGTRKRLLDAAIEIVGEDGFAGLTVASVSKRAEIATGTVYKHFETKNSLAILMYEEVAKAEFDEISGILLGPGLASDRILAAIELYIERAFTNPVLAFAIGAEPVDAEIDAKRLIYRHAYVGILSDVLESGIRDGEFGSQLTLITAGAIFGVLRESLVANLGMTSFDANLTKQQIIAAVQGFIIGGVMHPM